MPIWRSTLDQPIGDITARSGWRRARDRCRRLLVGDDSHRARRHNGHINDLAVTERSAEIDGEGCGRVALAALVAITWPDADPQLDLLGGLVQLDEFDSPLSAVARRALPLVDE